METSVATPRASVIVCCHLNLVNARASPSGNACKSLSSARYKLVSAFAQATIFRGKLGHKNEVFKSGDVGMRVPLSAIASKCLVSYPAEERLDLPSFTDEGLPLFYCHCRYDTLTEAITGL